MENEFKSFLKTVEGGEGERCQYRTRLDLYGKGCQHNCSYCYARSLLEFRKLWDADEPAVADMTKVCKALDKIPAGSVVRLGGMTDCFQPKELKHRNTYNAIMELNKRGIHYLIVTKSALVGTDEYIAIFDPELAHIQITITSTDDAISAQFEQASPISERVSTLEKLTSGNFDAAMSISPFVWYKDNPVSGYDVALRLSPFIPEFFDYDKLNAIKCNKVIVEFLRVNTWIKKWFNIDFSPYTLKSGGYLHLPLETKLEALKRIKLPNISVCEDVPEHYEYFKENFNVNKADCCNLDNIC